MPDPLAPPACSSVFILSTGGTPLSIETSGLKVARKLRQPRRDRMGMTLPHRLIVLKFLKSVNYFSLRVGQRYPAALKSMGLSRCTPSQSSQAGKPVKVRPPI